ncbi:hypothetical protein KKF11_02510 [Patescibacteria group bacterium]|nr:hypothetical protein [Patescibacteria group bacterium]
MAAEEMAREKAFEILLRWARFLDKNAVSLELKLFRTMRFGEFSAFVFSTSVRRVWVCVLLCEERAGSFFAVLFDRPANRLYPHYSSVEDLLVGMAPW